MSKTHNDNPVVSCQLARENWRKSIIRQIINADPPKVIGIHGTWGTGKTSLMAQMYTDLGGDHVFEPEDRSKEFGKEFKKQYGIESEDIQPIWFEAWQYQHEPNILAALLKEIRDQLTLPHRIWNNFKEDALVGIHSLLQTVSFKFKAFGAEFGIENPGKYIRENRQEFQKERVSEPLDAVLQKKMLKEAIDQLLKLNVPFQNREKKKQRKAVIFIDDLDRCVPDTAFRILESIKVYLNLDNCVFVLGMDLEQVEDILMQYHEKQYSEVDNKAAHLKNKSRLYLEKICQDIYHLPMPNSKQKIGYLKSLLTSRLGESQTWFNDLMKLADEYKVLPPFPRSIKIWANVIISYCSQPHIADFLSTEKEQGTRLRAFLIFTYLYAFHFDVYHLSVLYSDFYNQVFLEYCTDPHTFVEEKGEYPILSTLTVPTDFSDNKEVSDAKLRKNLDSKKLRHRYPDRNFRRVLWIGKLVKETEELDKELQNQLRMEASSLPNNPNEA